MAESGNVAGVLLAGGLSRRMGGGDKALLPLGGQTLIAQAAKRLAPQVSSLVINANGDPSRFKALALPVVPDDLPDYPGPLAGVLAALRWHARETPTARAVVSVSADAPFVPLDLVARLANALPTNTPTPVSVAQSHGRRHHVIALWSLECTGAIEAALTRGERRVEAIVDRLGAVAVPFPDFDAAGRGIDPFFNINTPDDLAFAETIMTTSAEQENAP
ncbi:molybdenum cofactor guanylyltransferase MobA [Hyphomicrobium sp. LHD-15]|uniref:molybdenum cofactor guanylyltransferase MobA n=1 Tax=Hyphomicrobium sp. LHD-15 TaxID=3072142 RepID=UPI00280C4A92|nr:molybdenum cofactor guanylyltransferase MobA [Hyphomicrobium sp. LHD-15]MDQ8698766.1 molybdenum cofactor guanylyltransferase MobA [Hyphomicrobium sp. LHD-15]